MATPERWKHLLSLPGVLLSNTLFYVSVASRGPLSDSDININQHFPLFNMLPEKTDVEKGPLITKSLYRSLLYSQPYFKMHMYPSICIHTEVRHEVIYKRDRTVRSHDSMSNVSWAVSHIGQIYSLIFHTLLPNNLAPSTTPPRHALICNGNSNHVLHFREVSPRCDSVHTFSILACLPGRKRLTCTQSGKKKLWKNHNPHHTKCAMDTY